MNRMTVAEAERSFSALVDKVQSEGVSIELQRGESIVAYLTPARPQSVLKVKELTAFLAGLPRLHDEADAFSADLKAIRDEMPSETDPWG